MKPGAPLTLGLIGTCPKGVQGPAAFDAFARFQQHLGELEAAPVGSYSVAHAACAAFMNGVPRVAFAGLADPSAPEGWAVAVTRLVDAWEPTVVVAPGLVDLALVKPLIAAFAARTARIEGREPPTLWLDAPDRADADAVLAYAVAVGVDGEQVRVASPWVPTLTPGRRQYERLPPTCLLAPLALGLTTELRGVSEAESPFGLDDLARLEAAGVGVLAPVGPRRLVGAAFPLERPKAPPLQPPTLVPPGFPAPSDVEGDEAASELERELDELSVRLQHQGQKGPSLWKALVREATVVLNGYKARGVIAGFVVRCDESTGSTPDGHPVVEVGLAIPQRVEQLVLRVGGRGR